MILNLEVFYVFSCYLIWWKWSKRRTPLYALALGHHNRRTTQWPLIPPYFFFKLLYIHTMTPSANNILSGRSAIINLCSIVKNVFPFLGSLAKKNTSSLAEMCALSKSYVMFDVRFTRQSVESKQNLYISRFLLIFSINNVFRYGSFCKCGMPISLCFSFVLTYVDVTVIVYQILINQFNRYRSSFYFPYLLYGIGLCFGVRWWLGTSHDCKYVANILLSEVFTCIQNQTIKFYIYVYINVSHPGSRYSTVTGLCPVWA